MQEIIGLFSLPQNYDQYIKGFLILVIGILTAKALSKFATLFLKRIRVGPYEMLIEKVITYFLYSLVLLISLKTFGIDLKVILGAAGIFSVAIGFASQTSASNMISGLFLVTERPFTVGDSIKVDSLSGVVVNIGVFSTIIRTYDNLVVRVPNEKLMKSNIINLSAAPIRRMDLNFAIEADANIGKLKTTLEDLTKSIPRCLDEPKALFIIEGTGPEGLGIQYSVWTKRESFLEIRNQLWEKILTQLPSAGIKIRTNTRLVTGDS